MLREREGCFNEDFIFFGLFGPFSSLLEDLELLLDCRGLTLVLGLVFLDRLGLGSFLVGDRFGDLHLTMCTSAFTVLVLCLPSSSTWMGW